MTPGGGRAGTRPAGALRARAGLAGLLLAAWAGAGGLAAAGAAAVPPGSAPGAAGPAATGPAVPGTSGPQVLDPQPADPEPVVPTGAATPGEPTAPTDGPTATERPTGEPTTGGPTAGGPTDDGPTTGEPTTDGPTTDGPTAGEPTGEPTGDGPATGEPTASPTAAPPTTGQPTSAEPAPTATGGTAASPSGTLSPTEGPSATAAPPATPTPTAPAPATREPSRTVVPPAVQDSGVTLAQALLAAGALAAAGLVLVAVHRHGRRSARGARSAPPGAPAAGAAGPAQEPPGPADLPRGAAPDRASVREIPAPEPPQGALVPFLVALGEAMIDSGAAVNTVQDALEGVAAAQGAPEAEVVVLPTALIVSAPGAGAVQTAVAAAGTSRLRLDQVAAVFAVVDDAQAGGLGPAEGLARLRAARAQPPPYRDRLRVVGYVVLSVGLALILRASAPDLLVAGLLGGAVGAGQVLASRWGRAVEVFLPVASAFAVSVVVFLLPRTGWDVGVQAPLISPLVTFLPGALLTTAVIELATNQMISGASRLAAGLMQLTLLALGIVAGAQLVGVPATSLAGLASQPLGEAAPWVGVALFGVGAVLHNAARWDSVGWVLLVLYVAHAAQVLGGVLLGGVLSAFVGALAMTPVAAFAATRRTGPPTLVTFLPAFWLLVPGALGLVGVTKVIGDDRVNGTDTLVTTLATMVAVAFGVLLGLAAGSAVAARGPRTAPGAGTPAGRRANSG